MENSRWRQTSDVRCEDRVKENRKVIITPEINFQQFVNHFSDHSVSCSPVFVFLSFICINYGYPYRPGLAAKARSSHNGFVFIFTLHSDRSPKAARRKRREISVRIRREIMTATYKAGRTPINSINQISECEVENYIVAVWQQRIGRNFTWKWIGVFSPPLLWEGAPRCFSSLARERDRLSSCCLCCALLFIAVICVSARLSDRWITWLCKARQRL